MELRIGPDVPTCFGEPAGGQDALAIGYIWRRSRQYMKNRESICDVIDLNVVRDYVALDPRGECFSKVGISIDPKTIRRGGKENIRGKFALRIEHARFSSYGFGRLAHIVRNLSVQETDPVVPRDAKLCASGEIKKYAFTGLMRRRHAPLDEIGCFNNCFPRRSNRIKKPTRGRVASLVSSPNGAGSALTVRSLSCSDSGSSKSATMGSNAGGIASGCVCALSLAASASFWPTGGISGKYFRSTAKKS